MTVKISKFTIKVDMEEEIVYYNVMDHGNDGIEFCDIFSCTFDKLNERGDV